METPTEQVSEVDSVLQWKQQMPKLLVVLNQLTLTNPTAENKKLKELQTSGPEAARAGILNPAVSFQFDLASYRPGDLSLVTRSTMKHKHIHSRTGAGFSVTQVPLYRKPTSQKTAGSLNSTDSAVRFLTSRIIKPK